MGQGHPRSEDPGRLSGSHTSTKPTSMALPFEDIHSAQLADGPGTPLVLAHALGLDHRMWAAVIEAQQGLRPVIAYDHRGHGRSVSRRARWTLDTLVDDAAAVIRKHADVPVVFAGLSMGGMVAQGLAIRHPQLLCGLVLAHTVAAYEDAGRTAWAQRVATVRAQGMGAVVDPVVQRYLRQAFREAHPQAAAQLRQRLLDNDADAYATSCEAVASVNFAAQLGGIATRTLVIAGRHDMGAPVAAAERITAAIPGAGLQVLEHSSHLGPVEEPLAFNAHLGRFLAAIDARG